MADIGKRCSVDLPFAALARKAKKCGTIRGIKKSVFAEDVNARSLV